MVSAYGRQKYLENKWMTTVLLNRLGASSKFRYEKKKN